MKDFSVGLDKNNKKRQGLTLSLCSLSRRQFFQQLLAPCIPLLDLVGVVGWNQV